MRHDPLSPRAPRPRAAWHSRRREGPATVPTIGHPYSTSPTLTPTERKAPVSPADILTGCGYATRTNRRDVNARLLRPAPDPRARRLDHRDGAVELRRYGLSQEHHEGGGNVARALRRRTEDDHAAMTPTAEGSIAEATVKRARARGDDPPSHRYVRLKLDENLPRHLAEDLAGWTTTSTLSETRTWSAPTTAPSWRPPRFRDACWSVR
jgi:hypothetical protein